eukprot:403349958
MEEQSFEGELTFNNNDYLVTVRQIQQTQFDPLNQRLYLEVEEKLTGNIWKADFQAKYIEDITVKTGVAKKFNVFVKMLIQAFKSQNESVCIDLLTYSDLEALKNKRPGQANTSTQNQSQINSNNNKRYFILTYITEFERVHYPLSLNYVEEPEADQLRRTIERMRNLIVMQKSNAFSSANGQGFFGQGPSSKNFSQTASQAYNKIEDFASIELENEQLRRQINEMEAQFSQSHQEFFNVSQQKFYTESEYDKFKRNAQKEIMTFLTSGPNYTVQQNPSSQMSDADHVKRQLKEISSQLDQERSTTGTIIEKQEKEIEECKKELDDQRDNERKLKIRQKELQDELDHTLKRIEQLQRGVSTPVRRKNPIYTGGTNSNGGSRNASPYSRNSSGNKKTGQGTPGSNIYGRVGAGGNNNRVGSNGRTTGGAVGSTGVQRSSPTTQNRFGSNTYKPPSSLRQNSNTRQSPTTQQRAPIGQQQRQSTYQQRNSSNNRSGSNNNRTGAAINNKPMVGANRNNLQNQKTSGQSSTGVYDRLYGNKNTSNSNTRQPVSNSQQQIKSTSQSNPAAVVDYQQLIPERDNNTESLNINIQAKSYEQNKENQQKQIYSSAYEPVVQRQQQQEISSNNNNMGSGADDIDVKDINSKLSRLQDLLQKAKQQ